MGFDPVECHWPYDTPPDAVTAMLGETGLEMPEPNTPRGASGENGLSALPGRGGEAREAIDRAIGYAAAVGIGNVHVMAGISEGPAAPAAFVANLRHACARAAHHGITILIEPLNAHAAPGYFLRSTDQAVAIIGEVGAGNLRLMFDCYHMQLSEGDLSRRIERLLPLIGHVQFAAVPDRGPPDHGEVDYRHIFALLDRLGWDNPLGAEYRPGGDTGATLGWLDGLQRCLRQEAGGVSPADRGRGCAPVAGRRPGRCRVLRSAGRGPDRARDLRSAGRCPRPGR